MRIIDYKEQYEAIQPGQYFLILVDDEWVVSIARSLKNDKLFEYQSLFISHQLTDEYIENNFMREINLKGNEVVRTLVCSYDMFLAYNRRSIMKSLQWCYDNGSIVHSKNFHLIREELKSAGGKCVVNNNGDVVYFLGATSTDEDYYYIYIDKNYKISCDSCVGGFGKELDEVPKELKKFVECKSEIVSQKVYDALWLSLSKQPEVFFTPIYFDFIDKYALPNLKMMNFLFEAQS